ncbi:ankyrin [Ophiobolus disseminans]|uniref:Ankyrin n=1 Tax=Ophiobolus disseminans TaxID=1469910 RepID=A0A6A7ABA0_9PLEO|nr:ankyrin [Ophiobolus disseminans]
MVSVIPANDTADRDLETVSKMNERNSMRNNYARLCGSPDGASHPDQLSSTETVAPKSQSNLLDLPLVLVQDILEHLVQCYTMHRSTSMSHLLSLRVVDKLFNAEMSRFLGRKFHSWIDRDRNRCLWTAPHPFLAHLLHHYIGEHDRKTSNFATRMHAAIDCIMQQLQLVNTPKKRHEVLSAVCSALARRPFQRYHDMSYSPTAQFLQDAKPIAFIVALMTPYEAVVQRMLAKLPSEMITNAKAWVFGTPLEVMISLGDTDHVRLLLNHGAWLETTSADRALEKAAQMGHADTIELVLQTMLANPTDASSTLQMYGRVAHAAAQYQQWDIVTRVLDRHKKQWHHSSLIAYTYSICCRAARFGKDDVVYKTICRFEVMSMIDRSPLHEAALGGHLSTCKRLAEPGALPSDIDLSAQTEELARCVAKGGSVDVCEFLRPLGLWKLWEEIHFLPIAAETGNLAFAKFAVKNGCDKDRGKMHYKKKFTRDSAREIRYPEDLRRFALWRGIVSGHLDIVRWLVCEVGVPVRKDPEQEEMELLPLDLAISTGRKNIVALLENLGAEQGPARTLEECAHWQQWAVETMLYYQNALRLRIDYNKKLACEKF